MGINPESTAKFIATPGGVVTSRSVRLKPEKERFSSEELGKVKGVPWSLVPKADEAPVLPQSLVLRPEVPEIAPKATRAHKVEVGGKSTYLTRAFFTEYGFTPGCPACES